MAYILERSIEELKETKNILADASNLEWLATLSPEQVNGLFIRLACVLNSEDIKNFFTQTLSTIKINPVDHTEDEYITLFTYNRTFLEERMIEMYGSLTTGPTPRNPENRKEEILYCLCTALEGSLKIPSKIVMQFLQECDLTTRIPNYDRDVLNIVCMKGNIEYINFILHRAGKEMSRVQLLEYVEDRYWCWNRDDCTMEFVTSLQKIFSQLEIPFSLAVHGKYFTRGDILSVCHDADVLKFCFGFLPTKHRSFILEKRAFEILCNFPKFKEAVELFESEKVDMNVIFQQRCKEKNMCLLDKQCLDGTKEDVEFLLSKMSKDTKYNVLLHKNYGFRTPLKHALYYGKHETALIIEKEMKIIGLL